MKVQFSIASNQKGIVVGTDHSAENVTGFYTKYGDGAADIAPLFGLNKRQGKQLLAYLEAPKHLYEKRQPLIWKMTNHNCLMKKHWV